MHIQTLIQITVLNRILDVAERGMLSLYPSPELGNDLFRTGRKAFSIHYNLDQYRELSILKGWFSSFQEAEYARINVLVVISSSQELRKYVSQKQYVECNQKFLCRKKTPEIKLMLTLLFFINIYSDYQHVQTNSKMRGLLNNITFQKR